MAKTKQAKSVGEALEKNLNYTVGHRSNIKLALRIRVLQLLEEYIGEAEHSEGEEYWDQFPTAEPALKDFILCYGEVLGDELSQPPPQRR